MEQLKDEFSNTPVTCPVCGEVAISVHKTGNKIFYNHGDVKVIHKEGQRVEVTGSVDMSKRECFGILFTLSYQRGNEGSLARSRLVLKPR